MQRAHPIRSPLNDAIAKIREDLSQGRYPAAQKKVKILARKEPKNPSLQNFAGVCFAQGNMHRASIPYFNAAYHGAPDNAEFFGNLALALIMSDEASKADALTERLLKTHPTLARLHYLRALNFHRIGDYKLAVAAADKALDLDPQMVDAINIRGLSYASSHRTNDALADFQSILALNPADLNAHLNCAERLNELGRKQEALAHYTAMLRLSPTHTYALSKIAALCDTDDLPQISATLVAALADRSASADDTANLNMAMATVLDRQRQPAEAMAFYTRAHAIDAKDRPYNSAAAWARHRQMRALFPARVAGEAQDCVSPAPIFVVGLPRSGTTLVEMILGAHPQVRTCGELILTEKLFREVFGTAHRLKPGLIRAFADSYRAGLPDMPPQATCFVDKMPANFRYVGLLLTAFPNARLINVQRDPRDVALSMWRQRFSAKGMSYASKMSSIADQANLYRSYMSHWSALYPEQILSICYENLVRDLNTGSQQLASHCGLQHVGAMLHPEMNTEVVRTASLNQVRDRVHTRSIDQWSVLGDTLNDLIAGLDFALWQPSC